MSNIILSRLRRSAFWSLDRFRGRPVRTAYDEIATIDGLDSDDPVVKNHQENRLTKIIEHAVTTTDFYRQFSKNIPLERLPVVNKDVIRRQQHKFLSSTYNKNQLITMRTSGSTGMPFVSYQDLAKKCRVHGEVIYYSEKAGYAVGKNLVYLRALTEHNRK